jgi:uncharacterized membrane protein HdeD (DUF308 family)
LTLISYSAIRKTVDDARVACCHPCRVIPAHPGRGDGLAMSTISSGAGAAASRSFGEPGTGTHIPRWVAGVAGGLSLVVGIAALVWPKPTLLAVGLLFGVYLFIWGIGLLVAGIGREDVGTGMRVLDVLMGLLALIAGLVLMVRPGESVVTAALVLGFWWCVLGTAHIISAIMVPGGRLANLVWGALGLAAGLIILASPEIGLATLVLIVGISLIVQGVLELMVAFGGRAA